MRYWYDIRRSYWKRRKKHVRSMLKYGSIYYMMLLWCYLLLSVSRSIMQPAITHESWRSNLQYPNKSHIQGDVDKGWLSNRGWLGISTHAARCSYSADWDRSVARSRRRNYSPLLQRRRRALTYLRGVRRAAPQIAGLTVAFLMIHLTYECGAQRPSGRHYSKDRYAI